jgi:hypothetical protein
MRCYFNTISLLAVLIFIEGCTPKKITITKEEKLQPYYIEEEVIMVDNIIEKTIEEKHYLRLMNNLDELIFTKLDIELSRDKERIIHNKKNIVTLLDEFVLTSQKLKTDTPPHLITEEYMDFVESLVYKGNFLKGLIEKENIAKIDKGISMITNTCNSCHAIYR